jgi:hypothetical protein
VLQRIKGAAAENIARAKCKWRGSVEFVHFVNTEPALTGAFTAHFHPTI